MFIKPNIKDVWIIHYSVPNKNKNDLLRPFIVVNIINDQIYGIPITSFKEKRYREELGDFILENQFLDIKSIIKPYQIIKIKPNYFKNRIGTVDDSIVNKINKSIDINSLNYLSMKNISSIMREYVIERQNQKITSLEIKVQLLEKENKELKRQTQNFQKELKSQYKLK